MTETEKAIIDFCGHHADWWPSTTQVQEMLALAQPEQEPVGFVDSKLNPIQRSWVSLTDEEIYGIGFNINVGGLQTMKAYKAIEAKLRSKNENR